jgi:hypothetical protein
VKEIVNTEYEIDISRTTIKRRAHENGIRGYAPIVKPLLDKEKANKRLTFAIRMKKVLKEDPNLLYYMVFTDETKLRVFEQQVGGNVSVRCREDERYDPENVNGKVKYGGGGITFWGCINYDRLGILHQFEENMTGEIYSKEILKSALKKSITKMKMEVEEAVIVEDLDPKHSLRCGVSCKTAKNMRYNILEDYPPSSPDLNPIEPVWALLKKRVRDREPKKVEQLK